MIEKLKQLINKENFDYSKGQVNPFQFHPTLYFIVKAFQVLDNEPIPKWTYFALPIMAADALIALAFAVIETGHGIYILDIPTMTEGAVYGIVLAYKLLILSCTLLNKPQYHCFMRIMREDFRFVCAEGSKYRDRFFANQLVTWKVSLFSVIFTGGIGVGMVTFAVLCLLFHVAAHSPGDGSQRPLLFPFWLGDVNFGATPIYEVTFIFSNFCVLAYAYNYIFMIQTQIIWIRQITSKADLVVWAIQELLRDVYPATDAKAEVHHTEIIKYRMREILSQHHSMYTLMEAYAGVYKKLLMFEQKLCGPVVCLTAFCTAEKLKEGEFNAILALLCVGTFILALIPSYLCTFLSIKVKSICDACWDTSFWNAGPVIRPYFVLIMQRSLRPLPLQAPGFEEVSLKTFSSKMTSAYSLFNMLRQTNI